MSRTWANRLLFAGLVIRFGALVAAYRVPWLPDPCLLPFPDEERQLKREVAATSNG